MLYLLSGTLGVLKSSAVDEGCRFSLSRFFTEAGRNFTGFLWLLSTLMAGFMAVMIVFAVIGGTGFAVIKSLGDTGISFQVFLKSFITLSYIIVGVLSLFAAIVFAAYSITVSIVEGTGTMVSIRTAYYFLLGRPGAFLFYMILLAGLLAANVVFIPFSIIPLAAPLINTVLQSYLSIVLWSSLLVYYMKNRGNTVTNI